MPSIVSPQENAHQNHETPVHIRKQHALTWIWKNRNSHTLLGGNEPRGSHSESRLAVLQKVTKIELQSDPAIPLLGV